MTEEASKPIPTYVCHKEVQAFKIKLIQMGSYDNRVHEYEATLLPEDQSIDPVEVDARYVLKHSPKPGGYYVRYEDGYESWSPADAFEKGYTLKEG